MDDADTDSSDPGDMDGEQPVRPGRRRWLWVWGGLFAVAAVAGSLFLFGRRGVPAAPPTSMPSETVLPPTEVPTATLEPTPLPTPTLPPTATPELTVEVTEVPSENPSPTATEGMILALAFESYVRVGPGVDFDSLAYLEAGTELLILGRDLDGF